jgi:hypothetical protein
MLADIIWVSVGIAASLALIAVSDNVRAVARELWHSPLRHVEKHMDDEGRVFFVNSDGTHATAGNSV